MVSKLFKTAVLVMIAIANLADVQAGSIVGDVKYVEAPPKLPLVKVSKDPVVLDPSA
jgi:hypothetical protein